MAQKSKVKNPIFRFYKWVYIIVLPSVAVAVFFYETTVKEPLNPPILNLDVEEYLINHTEVSKQDFLFPSVENSNQKKWTFAHDQIKVWTEEDINNFWLEMDDINIETLENNSDQFISNLLDESNSELEKNTLVSNELKNNELEKSELEQNELEKSELRKEHE